MGKWIDGQIAALKVDNPDDMYAATLLRTLEALKKAEEALKKITETKPAHGMNMKAKMSDPPELKVCWNVHAIARDALKQFEDLGKD